MPVSSSFREERLRTRKDTCWSVAVHDDDGSIRCALLGAISFFSAAFLERIRPLTKMRRSRCSFSVSSSEGRKRCRMCRRVARARSSSSLSIGSTLGTADMR